VQPGPAHPATTRPGTAQAGTAQPGTAQPGTAARGPAQPGRRQAGRIGDAGRPGAAEQAKGGYGAAATPADVPARRPADAEHGDHLGHPAYPEYGDPHGQRRRDPAERGLRGLVAAGPSQVGVIGAMRARDASRPRPEDIEAAERELTIVRRFYVPPDGSTPTGPAPAGDS
jgi:hypothetical protein